MGKLIGALVITPFVTMALSLVGVLDPRGFFAGILFGGSILLLIVLGPIWAGLFMARRMQQATAESVSTVPAKALEALSDNEICDLVDTAVNKEAAVANHPWLAQHWHRQTVEQKQGWVKDRRAFLNSHLKASTQPMDFVVALQNADKEHSRKAA